jgi:hypothetical protein
MTRPPHQKSGAPRRVEEPDTERLRAAWAEGIASGDDGPVDMAAIIEEAKREAAKDH